MTQFQPSFPVVLNGSGNGSIAAGPRNSREIWQVKRCSTRVTTNVLEPTFRAYLGPVSDSNFLGGSFSGSQDSDPEFNVLLKNGDFITGEWTGGDAGATATMTLTVERLYG